MLLLFGTTISLYILQHFVLCNGDVHTVTLYVLLILRAYSPARVAFNYIYVSDDLAHV